MNSRLQILCFVSALIILLGACKSKKEQAMELLNLGNKFLKEGNLSAAESRYSEALDKYKDFPDAYNNLGIIRHQQKRYYEAIDYYDIAISINPEFLKAYLNRSSAFYESWQFHQALEDLNQLEKFGADSFNIPFRKGLIYTQMKDYSKAISAFSESLKKDSLNVVLWTNLGTVHYYVGDLDSAIADLDRALDINPEEGDALNTLALVYLKQNDFARSKAIIRRALQKAPEDSYYHNNYGEILMKSGLLDSALYEIDKGLVLDPDNGWAYRNKGMYYLQMGALEKALEMFSIASRKRGNIENLYSYWAQALHKTGDSKSACEKIARARERKEKLPLPNWAEECSKH